MMSNIYEPMKAFIDTNVLAQMIGGSKRGQEILNILRSNNFEIVTFRKCVYELYSIIRGTTKDFNPGKNHPLKSLLPPEINTIAQKLFKKDPDIDELGNTYYWYNLYDGPAADDYFLISESDIEQYLKPSDKDKAYEFVQKQKEFAQWRKAVFRAFSHIDSWIEQNRIRVCVSAAV